MLEDVIEKIPFNKIEDIKVYRQALRDLPDNINNINEPEDLIWPVKPVIPSIVERETLEEK